MVTFFAPKPYAFDFAYRVLQSFNSDDAKKQSNSQRVTAVFATKVYIFAATT